MKQMKAGKSSLLLGRIILEQKVKWQIIQTILPPSQKKSNSSSSRKVTIDHQG
jgi:hypothetical protein